MTHVDRQLNIWYTNEYLSEKIYHKQLETRLQGLRDQYIDKLLSEKSMVQTEPKVTELPSRENLNHCCNCNIL